MWQAMMSNSKTTVNYSLLAEIAWSCFVGPFDLISIIYINIQNLLCNSAAPCHHIIHTKFHKNQTYPDAEETISMTTDNDDGSPSHPISFADI